MDERDLIEEKRALRALARAALAKLGRRELHELGLALGAALGAESVWRGAESVFCFYGAAGEPDTRPILRAALEQGKRLYLPRCLPGRPGEMEAVRLRSPEDVRPGAFGIPEPAGDELAAPEELGLALLPCLAAAPDGARLGHSGGYYDRFLSRFRGVSVVLCPRAAVFPALPCGKNDRRAQYLLTEAGFFRCAGGPREPALAR